MTTKKTAAPALAHRDGQKRAIVKKHILILSILRAAVKFAATLLAVYLIAAVAALNLLACLAAVLAENALLGLYCRMDPRKEVPHDPAENQNCI